jgi:hypothetical protein
MKKPKALAKENPSEISLTDLTTRINEREKQIELTCSTTMLHARNAVILALEQGADLLLARSIVTNASRGSTKRDDGKGWQRWLIANFPKSDDTARKYMALAEKAKTARARVLQDVKSIREAFRVLGLLPEPEPEQKQLPSITVSPVIARLNYIAEWAVRSVDEIAQWEAIRRQELKLQLRPVVELFEKL